MNEDVLLSSPGAVPVTRTVREAMAEPTVSHDQIHATRRWFT